MLTRLLTLLLDLTMSMYDIITELDYVYDIMTGLD